MTSTRKFFRTFGQFLANGTTPLAPTTNNTLTLTPAGSTFVTTLRLRTSVEIYILAKQGGTTPLDLAPAYETIIALGSIMYVSGAVTNSQIPLTNADPVPVTGSLGNWTQWEYLYPTIDFVDTSSPQSYLVTWRPKDKTIDTQARRKTTGATGIDLFMPWEVQDGSGLINTTTAGNTYELGARFSQELLGLSDGTW